MSNQMEILVYLLIIIFYLLLDLCSDNSNCHPSYFEN